MRDWGENLASPAGLLPACRITRSSSVLGETSLERKCRFLFGGCLLVLITGSFWWTGSRNEELVYAEGRRDNGRGKIDNVMLPNPLDHRTFGRASRAARSSINRAKTLQSNREYTSRVLIPEATDKEHQPENDFEAKVLERFIRAPTPDATVLLNGPPEYAEELLRDKQEYRYFQPIRLREECMEKMPRRDQPPFDSWVPRGCKVRRRAGEGRIDGRRGNHPPRCRKRKRRSTGIARFSSPRPSSPCFWRCWLRI